MSLFVLADLHLCKGDPSKTMSVFNGWSDYQERIEKNWLELVKEDDTIVLPGDISWGMSLEEAAPDFRFIESLPGEKIIIKGNHDYWWTTMKKMEGFLSAEGFGSIKILHDNHYKYGDYGIVGFWAEREGKLEHFLFCQCTTQARCCPSPSILCLNRKTIRLRLILCR